MNYREFNDHELLSYVAEADTMEESSEILIKKYQPLVVSMAQKKVSSCANLGIELKDLIQEGYLGLYQAIDTYDAKKDVLFYTYAKTCIESRMLSLIISSRRLKHKILNESVSYEMTEDIPSLEAVLEDTNSNPESYIIENENLQELTRQIKERLTSFEQSVFDLKVNHFTYREIAELLDKDPKAIDNAMQRIKTKVSTYLKEKGDS